MSAGRGKALGIVGRQRSSYDAHEIQYNNSMGIVYGRESSDEEPDPSDEEPDPLEGEESDPDHNVGSDEEPDPDEERAALPASSSKRGWRAIARGLTKGVGRVVSDAVQRATSPPPGPGPPPKRPAAEAAAAADLTEEASPSQAAPTAGELGRQALALASGKLADKAAKVVGAGMSRLLSRLSPPLTADQEAGQASSFRQPQPASVAAQYADYADYYACRAEAALVGLERL